MNIKIFISKDNSPISKSKDSRFFKQFVVFKDKKFWIDENGEYNELSDNIYKYILWVAGEDNIEYINLLSDEVEKKLKILILNHLDTFIESKDEIINFLKNFNHISDYKPEIKESRIVLFNSKKIKIIETKNGVKINGFTINKNTNPIHFPEVIKEQMGIDELISLVNTINGKLSKFRIIYKDPYKEPYKAEDPQLYYGITVIDKPQPK